MTISSILVFVGCSQSNHIVLGEVTGTVSFDSQPLAGAMVTFVPDDNAAKESYGHTDENGHYELLYKPNVKGAVAGAQHVRITTATEHKPKERLPLRYHRRTILTSVVEAGVNKIDFDLVSKSK